MIKKSNLKTALTSFVLLMVTVSMFFIKGKGSSIKISDAAFWQIFVSGMLVSVIIINLVAYFKSKKEG